MKGARHFGICNTLKELPMNLETVSFEKHEGIGVIKFNRPQVLNAMNHQLWMDLQTALEAARVDPQVKVIIITGEGRAFSTGADLKESKNRSPEEDREYLYKVQKISRDLMRFEKPTIAAINGYALGSGYELALACDIRIAAEDAVLGSPEARVASSVTGGAMRLLQQLVGPGKAKELLFTKDISAVLKGKKFEVVPPQRVNFSASAFNSQELLSIVQRIYPPEFLSRYYKYVPYCEFQNAIKIRVSETPQIGLSEEKLEPEGEFGGEVEEKGPA